MVFTPSENRLGLQPIGASVGTTTLVQSGQSTQLNQQSIPGEIIRAFDPTLGGGEFIYLVGVAGTVVGSLVTYDPVNKNTTLSSTTATGVGASGNQPLAVAMSANVSGYYGWYQIAGAAVIKKGAVLVLANVPLYLSGVTAGRVTSLLNSGREILNCRTVNAASVASAVSTITAVLQRPFSQGQVI
jgi:hypothetical protein